MGITNEAILEALASTLSTKLGQKHDLSSATPNTVHMHGLTGIFGVPGAERDVISTRVKPSGLLAILPAKGSNVEYPIVPYLTGFRGDEGGAEKEGVCETPLEAGEIKSCYLTAPFGRYERKTAVLEVNAIGRVVNRSEFLDLRIVNDPVLESGFSVPDSIGGMGNFLNNEILARWIALGVAFERLLGPQIYRGTPLNNTAGGGYREFYGLESLVTTGITDVFTGVACPALDSYVANYNFNDAGATANALVNALTVMVRHIQDIASRTGLEPFSFVLTMRRDLFNIIVDVWPCAYATYRCSAGNVADPNIARVLVDGERQREMADQMRVGKYLLIDGVQVPVVIDDFIPELTDADSANVDAGEFASDIYLIPTMVAGGMAATYLEYVDFSQTAMPQLSVSPGAASEFWTDSGRFLWTTHRTGWCVEWWAKIEPRLRLITPHLAGRLQNVLYSPTRHFREDDPDSPYFADGGNYERNNTPSFYSQRQ